MSKNCFENQTGHVIGYVRIMLCSGLTLWTWQNLMKLDRTILWLSVSCLQRNRSLNKCFQESGWMARLPWVYVRLYGLCTSLTEGFCGEWWFRHLLWWIILENQDMEYPWKTIRFYILDQCCDAFGLMNDRTNKGLSMMREWKVWTKIISIHAATSEGLSEHWE